ncbi:MAG: hypothetical protein MI863_22185 [Desulfobacterales bacterium]|nr:hypothetical protein [Desulfobacterales bacterium]
MSSSSRRLPKSFPGQPLNTAGRVSIYFGGVRQQQACPIQTLNLCSFFLDSLRTDMLKEVNHTSVKKAQMTKQFMSTNARPRRSAAGNSGKLNFLGLFSFLAQPQTI